MEEVVYIDLRRRPLLIELINMPEEAFAYLVLACQQSAMLKGANTQIWPDGVGGFTRESRKSIEAVRAAADVYLKES